MSNLVEDTYRYLLADAAADDDDTPPAKLLALEAEARGFVEAYSDQALDTCPACGGDDWARDGYAERKRGKVQVFRCRGCGKKRVGHGDTPFKHPLFPPEAMVLAVLLQRQGWTLKRISSNLVVTNPEGGLSSPNRQTVGRWIKKLHAVVTESKTAAPEDTAQESDTEATAAPERHGENGENACAQEGHPAPLATESLETEAPEPDDVIAERFEVERRLGEESGQAQGVYVVKDRWHPEAERVALKLIPEDGSGSLGREFGLRARLQHPNVAAVHDYGVLPDGRHWFTQLLVDGDDFYIAARGRPFEQILEWMVGVLRGCAYLHGRGIIHRDLKPDNILIDAQDAPRLVDFGISVARNDVAENSTSGSLAYLAPEALAGAVPGPLLDLFAVGRTIYHIIARELPPPPSANSQLPRLSDLRADVPPWFDDLLGRLTAYDPEDRYATALSVIDAIVEHSGFRFAYETEGTLVGRVRATVLVDRETDIRAAVERLGQSPSVVIVQAEAGLGKSRLLDALRQRHQMAGGEAVDGRLSTLVRAAVSRLGLEHPLVRHHRDVVERLTGGDSALPMLAPRDGIMRDRDAVLQLLAAGHGSSTLIIVDDLDRVNEPTATVLDALVSGSSDRDNNTRPRMLMATRTPAGDEQSPQAPVARWVADGNAVLMSLAPLTETGVRDVVAEALDQSPIAERLAPSIFQASEGNPRFVEEVLRGLLDGGVVARDAEGEWEVASPTESGDLPVPGELVQVCQLRIASLTDGARRLLELLAVADAPLPLLAADALSASLEDAALESLTSRALVREVKALTPDGPIRLAVAHDAVRTAALEGVSRFEVPSLKRSVAEALESTGCTDAALLATLWSDVVDHARALPWVRRAARRARERFDVEEALQWLTALDRLSDTPELKDAIKASAKAQTLRDLAQMLRFRGRHDEQSVCLDKLSLLAQGEDDAELSLEAAALKALFWFDRGRNDLAGQMCRSHAERAKALADKRPLARFLWVQAMVECRGGALEEGLNLSGQSLALLGDATDPEALELRVQNHINRGNALGQQGRLEGAQAALEKALAICDQHDLVSSAIVSTMNIGICLAMQARYGRALTNFDRARTNAERLGWRELRASLQVNQAEVERNLGMTQVAADRLAPLVAGFAPDRSDPLALSALCTMASCLAALGQQKEAREGVERAVGLVAPSLEHPLAGRALLTEAEVNLQEGTREARRRARKALEAVLEGFGPSHDKALSACRLARLALEDGDLPRALGLVERNGEALGEASPHEVREGLVERLHTFGRVYLAAGQAERATTYLERAADELERQSSGLVTGALETFLGLPIHRDVANEARRVLGRTIGRREQPVDWESELFHEGMTALRELTRAGGFTAVVDLALDSLIRFVDFERAILLTWEKSKFVPVGARLAGRTPVPIGTFGPSAAILDALVRTREAVVVHAEGFGTLGPTAQREPFAGLALPLIAQERLVGAVYLDHKHRQPPLSETRQLVVETLADQVALVLQHHLQVDEIERLRRRTEADLTRTRARLAEESARREKAERVVEVQRRTTKLRYRYDQIIHGSEPMRHLLSQVDRLVDRKITVLVNGESGTGKELIARALHYNGPRGDGPFVAINCGAIPKDLIESELFGHVRGAFTGAHKDRSGHFELAHTGTLFLDEIGEVSPDVQVRLLRVLETSEVTPVGASRRIKLDVRIVTATNRDLLAEVAAGRFREDLYYRLNTIKLRLPPLRERLEDLPLLVNHFIQVVAADRGAKPVTFPASVMRRLAGHHWPGNVRELRNVVEYAALFADDGVVPEDLVLPF